MKEAGRMMERRMLGTQEVTETYYNSTGGWWEEGVTKKWSGSSSSKKQGTWTQNSCSETKELASSDRGLCSLKRCLWFGLEWIHMVYQSLDEIHFKIPTLLCCRSMFTSRFWQWTMEMTWRSLEMCASLCKLLKWHFYYTYLSLLGLVNGSHFSRNC